MKYNSIVKYDVANGPGLRTSIFFTGCTLHCPGCFNYEIWDFNTGKEFDKEVEDKVIEMLKDPYCEGLSVLGGEPTDQGDALITFLRRVKEEVPEKEIWLWSGRTMEQISDFKPEFLEVIDVLIDGMFIESLKDVKLKWRGSSNQRIIYVKDNELANESNVVE